MASQSYTNLLSLPVRKLAEMVSESETFRARVGCDLSLTRQEGIDFLVDSGVTRRIYPTATRADQEGTLYGNTLAVVCLSGYDAATTSAASGWNWETTGSVSLTLTCVPQPQYASDLYESQYDAWNYFGGVMNDLTDLNALDDRLMMQSASMVAPGLPMNKQFEYSLGERWYVFAVEISWGSAL